MKTFITIVLALLISGCASYNKAMKDDPGKWTSHDTTLQATYTALHVMDWSQTLHISRNPRKHSEKNPILGEHPSEGRVNSYFALTLLGHTGISYLLPKPYRTIWQGTWIYIEYDVVQENRTNGLGISIHF